MICSLVFLGSIAIGYPFGNTLLNSSGSVWPAIVGILTFCPPIIFGVGVAPDTNGGSCPTGVLPKLISGKSDFKKSLKITEDVCKKNKKVIKNKNSPFVTIGHNHKKEGIYIDIRFYTDVDNYPYIIYTLQKEIMLEFQENHITF